MKFSKGGQRRAVSTTLPRAQCYFIMLNLMTEIFSSGLCKRQCIWFHEEDSCSYELDTWIYMDGAIFLTLVILTSGFKIIWREIFGKHQSISKACPWFNVWFKPSYFKSSLGDSKHIANINMRPTLALEKELLHSCLISNTYWLVSLRHNI